MINRLKAIIGSRANIVFVIIIVLLISFISSRRFVRLDLTEDKRYTISRATKEMLETLDDVVTVKIFFSKKLPPDLSQLAQIVRDTLDEYKSFSPAGFFDVRYLDPSEDESIRSEALSLGIPEVRMNFVEEDKVEVQNGFLGIGVYYEDKTETLPVVVRSANFEYDLTAAIKKATAEKIKTIGFLKGHGERSVAKDPFGDANKNGELSGLRDVLEKTYRVIEVDISKGDSITDVDTLVIVGPKEALSARDLYEIDQFLMNGGEGIFLVDGVPVSQTMQAEEGKHNMDALLGSYGFKVEKTLVKDAIHETAQFSQGFISFIVPYPLWPKLVKENFLLSNPIVSSLDSVVLPWSSPITMLDKDGIALASTTPRAFTIGSPFNLDPNDTGGGAKQEQLTMIAMKNVKLASFYSGKDIPAVEKKNEEAENQSAEKPALQSMEDSAQRATKLASDGAVRIILVGNSVFITDRITRQFPQNLNFIQNAIDYITLDDSLIEIRAKTFSERAIREISSNSAKNTMKFLAIFGMGIIVALAGFAKSWMRRKAKNKLLAL